jgi:very-short-patch-repair endonuclease
MQRHLPEYNKRNIPVARMLRRNMTDGERRLWSLLRRNQLGVKFRRQVPMGRYVLDFYCVKAKLNVELDGSQHYTPKGHENDAVRDEYLRQQGIKIMRFFSSEVLTNPDGVLQAIYDCIQERISQG